MPTLADYARPFEQGIMAGAQIGHTIAQNQIAREKMRRDLEQAQISNAIQERHTRILEADAALKAEQFQQLNDFGNLIRNTPIPGGGDLAPEDQPAMEAQRARNLMAQAPPAIAAKGLEQGLTDYEKEQRLNQQLAGMTQRANLRADQSDINSQRMFDANQARIDAAQAKTDAERAQKEKLAQENRDLQRELQTQRDAAAMARTQAVEGGRTQRNQSRQGMASVTTKTPSGVVTRKMPMDEAQKILDEAPIVEPGSDEEKYAVALQAREAGKGAGQVVEGKWVEGPDKWFNHNTPVDAAIKNLGTSIDSQTRQQINKAVKRGTLGATVTPEPDQTTPESTPAGEPAAIPVPTQAPGPKEKAEMANKIAAENPSWSRAQVLEELAKRLK